MKARSAVILFASGILVLSGCASASTSGASDQQPASGPPAQCADINAALSEGLAIVNNPGSGLEDYQISGEALARSDAEGALQAYMAGQWPLADDDDLKSVLKGIAEGRDVLANYRALKAICKSAWVPDWPTLG